MNGSSEKRYQEREKRVLDAIALKKPDRVPVLAPFGAFAVQYTGMTHEDEMGNVEKALEANFQSNMDFQPDMDTTTPLFGPVLKALDFRQIKWAGHGLPSDVTFQFVEDEYMKAEEYDAFLYDPSDFIVRTYWPRIFGKLKIFGALPPLRGIISY